MNCPHKDAVGDTGACGPCYAAALDAIKAAGERDHIYKALETVTEQRDAAQELAKKYEDRFFWIKERLDSAQECKAQELGSRTLCNCIVCDGFKTLCAEYDRLTAERDAALRERARMFARVYEGESEDCIFCAHYPATGHSQQVPMCPMCCAESELTRLRTLVEQREKERDAIKEQCQKAWSDAADCDQLRATLAQRDAELAASRAGYDAMNKRIYGPGGECFELDKARAEVAKLLESIRGLLNARVWLPGDLRVAAAEAALATPAPATGDATNRIATGYDGGLHGYATPAPAATGDTDLDAAAALLASCSREPEATGDTALMDWLEEHPHLLAGCSWLETNLERSFAFDPFSPVRRTTIRAAIADAMKEGK